MRILCVEGGNRHMFQIPWIKRADETIITYVQLGSNIRKGRCFAIGCPVGKSCARKMRFTIQKNGEMPTVVERLAKTGPEEERQKKIKEYQQLHDDVVQIFRDRGM